MTTPLVPLAHQGGWDEALVFVIPLALYLALRLYDRYRQPTEQDHEREQDPDEHKSSEREPDTSPE